MSSRYTAQEIAHRKGSRLLRHLRIHSRFVLALVAIALAAGAMQFLHGPLRIDRYVQYPARINGPFVGGQALHLRPALAAQLAAWNRQYDDRREFAFAGVKWRRQPMIQWPMNLGEIQKLGESYRLEVSPWWVAVGTGMIAFPLLRRRIVPQAGTCLSCGYDLRATPARCPECGTLPARAV
jgi:hypothetical protein